MDEGAGWRRREVNRINRVEEMILQEIQQKMKMRQCGSAVGYAATGAYRLVVLQIMAGAASKADRVAQILSNLRGQQHSEKSVPTEHFRQDFQPLRLGQTPQI